MWTNKSIMLFVLSLIAVVLLSLNMANAEEKTITPKEFGTAIAETPGKIVKFISSEVDKTKEYQRNSWADMKTKWPWTMFKGNQ